MNTFHDVELNPQFALREPASDTPHVFTNALIVDPEDQRRVKPATVTVVADKIVAVDQVAPEQPHESEIIDCQGALLLPGLTNAHAHVDKSWWGIEWQSWGGERSLQGRISHERARRGELGIPGKKISANVVTEFLRHGTTHVRSHVDVDPGIGLSGLAAVREAVAEVAPGMKLELVAFPQDGILRTPGTKELLREAAREHLAEHIGGLDPAGIDRDPVGQLDFLFALADETGVGIDIHLHDQGSLGQFQFELILDRVEALDLRGKVTIAHGLALGGLPRAVQESLVTRMAEMDVRLTTVAALNVPPLPRQLLRENGVRLGFGTDGIRDLWSPYGDGDTLRVATQYARMSAALPDEELLDVLEWASRSGHEFAEAGVDEPADAKLTLIPDTSADFFAVPAENAMDALVRAPKRMFTVAGGNIFN